MPLQPSATEKLLQNIKQQTQGGAIYNINLPSNLFINFLQEVNKLAGTLTVTGTPTTSDVLNEKEDNSVVPSSGVWGGEFTGTDNEITVEIIASYAHLRLNLTSITGTFTVGENASTAFGGGSTGEITSVGSGYIIIKDPGDGKFNASTGTTITGLTSTANGTLTSVVQIDFQKFSITDTKTGVVSTSTAITPGVAQSIVSGKTLTFSSGLTNTIGDQWIWHYETTPHDLDLMLLRNSSGVEKVRIDEDGNVFINTVQVLP